MTRTSLSTGVLAFILIVSLFIPAIGQNGNEEGVQSATEEEFTKIQEEVEALRKTINELSSTNQGQNQELEANRTAIDQLKKDQKSLQGSLSDLEETVMNRETKLDRISSLNQRTGNLENRMKKLVDELGELDQRISSDGQEVAELKSSFRSLQEEVSNLSDELSDVESSLTEVRKNSFDNEKKLADLEETYRASARRNLLVAASGIVVGLAGLTLFWAS